MSCLTDRDLSDSVGPETLLPPHVVECLSCRARREVFARDAALLRTQDEPRVSAERVARVRAAVLEGAIAPRAEKASWVSSFARVAAALLLVVVRPLEVPVAPNAPVARAVVESSEGALLEHALSPTDEVVRLHRGRIRLRVAKLGANQRFRVLADDGEVEVRGTVFDVEVTDAKLSRVAVSEGLVVVRRIGHAAVWLEAGRLWQREAETVIAPQDGGIAPARRIVASAHVDASAPEPDAAPFDDATIAEVTPPIPAHVDASAPIAHAPKTDLEAAEIQFARGWDLLHRRELSSAADHFAQAEKLAGRAPLAEDAAYWCAMALHDAGDPDAADALQAFVSRYPSSPRKAAARALLDALLAR